MIKAITLANLKKSWAMIKRHNSWGVMGGKSETLILQSKRRENGSQSGFVSFVDNEFYAFLTEIFLIIIQCC